MLIFFTALLPSTAPYPNLPPPSRPPHPLTSRRAGVLIHRLDAAQAGAPAQRSAELRHTGLPCQACRCPVVVHDAQCRAIYRNTIYGGAVLSVLHLLHLTSSIIGIQYTLHLTSSMIAVARWHPDPGRGRDSAYLATRCDLSRSWHLGPLRLSALKR